MPDITKPTWDTKETAEYLGISDSEVNLRAHLGEIPAYNVARKASKYKRFRFKPTEIEKYLEASRVA